MYQSNDIVHFDVNGFSGRGMVVSFRYDPVTTNGYYKLKVVSLDSYDEVPEYIKVFSETGAYIPNQINVAESFISEPNRFP